MSSKESRSSRKRQFDELDTEEIHRIVMNRKNDLRLLEIGPLHKSTNGRIKKKELRFASNRGSSKRHRSSSGKVTKRHRSVRKKMEKNLKNRFCCCCKKMCEKCIECERRKFENSVTERKFERVAAALSKEDYRSEEHETNSGGHEPLIEEWARIIRQGLGATEIKELSVKYGEDDNRLGQFRAPELNVEVQNLVDATSIKFDEAYTHRQNQIGVLLSMVEKVLAAIVCKGKQSTDVARLVENLHDIGRSNADVYHAMSIARRRSIFRALQVDNVDDHGDVGDTLFSQSMEMLLYRQKTRLDFVETAKEIVAAWKEDIAQSRSAERTRSTQGSQTTQSQTTQTDEARRSSEMRESFQQQQQIVARIEENKIAKQEASVTAKRETPVVRITPGVPPIDEDYPGGKEVIIRVLRLRGVPEKFPKWKDGSWRTFNIHIRRWWEFCRAQQKDMANPSPEDVLNFYQTHAKDGKYVSACRTVMQKMIPENVACDPMLHNFYEKVKLEK